MSLRTPLGKVRGLGSAKYGVDQWWQERLAALALVPLGLWFIGSMISQVGVDYEGFKDWISTPGRAVAMILFLVATFIHMKLSLMVIIEDYVHSHAAAFVLRLVVTFTSILLGTASVFSVLKLALGG